MDRKIKRRAKPLFYDSKLSKVRKYIERKIFDSLLEWLLCKLYDSLFS